MYPSTNLWVKLAHVQIRDWEEFGFKHSEIILNEVVIELGLNLVLLLIFVLEQLSRL